MKPAPFDYESPATVEAAVALLDIPELETKVLAGGQSLIPLLALRLARFDLLVDLTRIGSLSFIRDDGGRVCMGSMITQATALSSSVVRERVPLLARALPMIGHFQIRNRGTVGGSLAHADPAAELPAVALLLDAELEIAGAGGRRTISAAEFFQGVWTTVLGAEDILTEVRFPCPEGRWGWALDEFSRRSGDFAIAGAAVGVRGGDDGAIEECRIAMFGVGPTPIRADGAGTEVVGLRPDAIPYETIGRLAAEGVEPTGDVHGSSLFRKEIAALMVAKALRSALGQLADA